MGTGATHNQEQEDHIIPPKLFPGLQHHSKTWAGSHRRERGSNRRESATAQPPFLPRDVPVMCHAPFCPAGIASLRIFFDCPAIEMTTHQILFFFSIRLAVSFCFFPKRPRLPAGVNRDGSRAPANISLDYQGRERALVLLPSRCPVDFVHDSLVVTLPADPDRSSPSCPMCIQKRKSCRILQKKKKGIPFFLFKEEKRIVRQYIAGPSPVACKYKSQIRGTAAAALARY